MRVAFRRHGQRKKAAAAIDMPACLVAKGNISRTAKGAMMRACLTNRGIMLLLMLAGLRWEAHGSLAVTTDPAPLETTVGLRRVAGPTTASLVGLSRNDTGLTTSWLAASPKSELYSSQVAASDGFDPATMMAVEEIRPGMKGYGLSVMSGYKPERFEAEVVGVRHNVFPETDIILCQLKHPLLEDIGVVAGMSGSPVFMEGKLIGAVAYGWSSSKEALAGITPIAPMMKVFASTPTEPYEEDESETGGSSFRAYQGYLDLRDSLSLEKLESLQHAGGTRSLKIPLQDLPEQLRNREGMPAEIEMKPLTAPLLIWDASPATVNMMRRMMPGFEIEGVQQLQPVSTWSPSAPAANSPGGPVPDLDALADELAGGYGLAVPFVEGDLSMSGVGTVTYRNGNRLIAFGHPMFGQGLVRFPMAPARINAISRNLVRPFKVGESLGQIGVIRQDRQPAIGALFGEQAEMFQVKSVVDDPAYLGRREFNYRVWNDRDMSPSFVMAVLGESMVGAARSGGDTVALYRYSLQFDDGTSITREDYISNNTGGIMAAMAAATDMAIMLTNPFKKLKGEEVDFHVRISDKLQQAQLLAITTDQDVYRPGDTATVTWDVQPYRRPQERMDFTFKLPQNLPDGTYQLNVTDGPQREMIEARRNPGGSNIYDFPSLVSVLSRNFPQNRVYITMVDEDTGAAVRGAEMPKLPSSIIGTIQETVESRYYAPVRGNLLVDSDMITNYEVTGRLSTTIKVMRQPNRN